MTRMVRQGDILLERVDVKAGEVRGKEISREQDGAVVLAHGEATGHRHALFGAEIVLYHDAALARDMQDETLYVGHLVIDRDDGELRHEKHETIALARGVWWVRRQREFDADMARFVED